MFEYTSINLVTSNFDIRTREKTYSVIVQLDDFVTRIAEQIQSILLFRERNVQLRTNIWSQILKHLKYFQRLKIFQSENFIKNNSIYQIQPLS